MSDNLALTQLTSNSVDFTVLVNLQSSEIDAAITELFSADFTSGNVTITATQFRRNFEFATTNLTSASVMTVQAIKRFFFVNNATGTADCTVKLGTTEIVIAAGGNGLFRTDGTANGLVQAAGGAGGASAFTDLSDTPANYTGQAGASVIVNSSANGLEFGAPVGLAARPENRGALVRLGANQSFTSGSGANLNFGSAVYDTEYQPLDTGDNQRFWLGANQTFVDGDVTVGTDVIARTSHGFTTGEGPVRLSSSGTLPAGLAVDTNYWIIAVDINTIAFATSRANAIANTRVDITAAAGGGTHTIETADKLIVPAGVSVVRVTASGHWASSSGGNVRSVAVVRNADFALFGRVENKIDVVDNIDHTLPIPGADIQVSEGDFFQLNCFQDSGGNLDIQNDSATFLALNAVVFDDNAALAITFRGFVGGVPATSTTVMRALIDLPMEIPAGGTGSQSHAGTAPNAETDFDLQKNGVSFGTMRFANAANTATFIVASATTFAAGDRLEIVSPANLNTLANLSFAIRGNRSV